MTIQRVQWRQAPLEDLIGVRDEQSVALGQEGRGSIRHIPSDSEMCCDRAIKFHACFRRVGAVEKNQMFAGLG